MIQSEAGHDLPNEERRKRGIWKTVQWIWVLACGTFVVGRKASLDGGEDETSSDKDLPNVDEKAIVEETPSALDRLMENACSFCATNTTTSS